MIALLVLVYMFLSCEPKTIEEIRSTRYSVSQTRIHQFLDEYDKKYDNAVNTARQHEVKSEYEKKLISYIKDSLNSVLIKFGLIAEDVKIWSDTHLVFEGRDNKNEYWSELVYKSKDSMLLSQLYKNLSGIPKDTDTCLSFVVLNIEVKKEKYSRAKLRIETIPIPDSSAVEFQKKYTRN